MTRLDIEGLPDSPLDAAAAFHESWAPRARDVDDDVLLVMPLADHTHRNWRVSAVQELAREAVPRRLNCVASDSEAAIEQVRGYLAEAPGITGQYLMLAK